MGETWLLADVLRLVDSDLNRTDTVADGRGQILKRYIQCVTSMVCSAACTLLSRSHAQIVRNVPYRKSRNL